MSKVFIGPKLRQLRNAHNHTQAKLAKRIGVSAAYVNLLENNQRNLTVKVLMALTDLYGVSAQDLAQETDANDLSSLRLMVRDPIFTAQEPDLTQLRAALTHAPQFVERFRDLYQDYQRLADHIQANMSDDTLGAAQSGGEAGIYDFFKRNRNHFPNLEQIAQGIRTQLACPQDELYHTLKTFLHQQHGITCQLRKLSDMGNTLMNFDDANKTASLSEALDAPNRIFQLAYILAQLEAKHALLHYDIKHQNSKDRLINELLNYIAAAIIMPYEAFLDIAKLSRYDIDRLAAAFGVTFEQAAHRLTTLNGSGQQGIPFFFIRLDRAGNVTKRINPLNSALADFGGRCPVWNIHSAFQNPHVVIPQLIELPDGTQYASLARTTDRSVYSRQTQDRRLVAVLGCDIRLAKDITYFDGLDAQERIKPVQIGLTCQTCPQHGCTQRAHNPVHMRLNFDPHRRGATRYEN